MGATENHPVKSIAILGANGQIGNIIYHHLRQHYPHVEIKACVRQIPGYEISKDYKAFHPFSDNWQTLEETDVLINSIGIIEESKHFTFEQTHIGLTKRMLQYRRAIGNPKIIQISAVGADAGSPVRFLSTKGKADELLLMSRNTAVVRPSIVCTPETMIVQKMRLLGNISKWCLHCLPFPEQLLHTFVQPVIPEDLAALVTRLCFTDHHPDIVPAVGPHKISLTELIKLTNPDIRLLPISKAIAGPCMKLVSRVFPGLISRQQYELLHYHNVADNKSMEQLLGRAAGPTEDFWRKSS
jgi:hypothetical protein